MAQNTQPIQTPKTDKIYFGRNIDNIESQSREFVSCILNHRMNSSIYNYVTCTIEYVNIKIVREVNVFGINSYSINIFDGIINRHIYNIPYMPKSVIDFIKQLHVFKCKTDFDIKLTAVKFKKEIEEKLREDSKFQQLLKFNIVEEIQQLKKSTSQSTEIIELQKTTSTIKADITRLTTLLENDTSTKFVEDMNKKLLQTEKLIDHLLEEKDTSTKFLQDMNKKILQTESLIDDLLEEKEYHKLEMSTMHSTILQLQEDIKLLFGKTFELQYENTRLKKLIYL